MIAFNDALQPALRQHDEIAYLANSAETAGLSGDPMHRLPQREVGIGHRHGQPDPPQQGQIEHIIADKSRLLRLQSQTAEQFLEGLEFVFPALVDMFNTKTAHAQGHRGNCARR